MRFLKSRAIWGALLIVLGILFLLESLEILVIGSAWAILFAIGGLAFGYTFLENRDHWWAIIPAFVLLSLGVLIGVDTYAPKLGDQWGGSIFLLGLALSFWVIFLTTRFEQWWAVIPGGILLTLAVLIGFEPLIGGDAFAGLLMLGFAATFLVVSLMPTPDGPMRWALIPAGVMGALGVILLTAATQLANLIWPTALILIGGYLLLRNARR
jgi:hypothetical protein